MAEAGFYHSSNDRDPDIARCFVCFKELEGWEPDDNPWYELFFSVLKIKKTNTHTKKTTETAAYVIYVTVIPLKVA